MTCSEKIVPKELLKRTDGNRTESEDSPAGIRIKWNKESDAFQLQISGKPGPHVILMRYPETGFSRTMKFLVASEINRLLRKAVR